MKKVLMTGVALCALGSGAIIALATPALAEFGNPYLHLSPNERQYLKEQEAKRQRDAAQLQQFIQQGQEAARKRAESIKASVGADAGCALNLLPCMAHAGEPDPCADPTLKTTMAMTSPHYSHCLDWRLQRQRELAAKMKTDPLAFALPWSKTDSEDVKYDRYSEKLKVLSHFNDAEGVPQINLLFRQGYTDGGPKLKSASDWVCQQAKETPGSYLEACGEHEAAERAKAQAAKEAWGRTPVGRVYNGYFHYSFVKYCHDVREGYQIVYINDIELARAETAIRAIVDKAKAEDHNINTDQQWQTAQHDFGGQYVNMELCHFHRDALFRISPVAVYSVEKPE